jgi:MFS family permease
MKFGFIGLGSSVLLMSLLPPYWVLLILGAVLGFSWGPLMPMLNTVIQRVIPENMRGRVFGIEMTIWGAGPTLTAVAVGIMAIFISSRAILNPTSLWQYFLSLIFEHQTCYCIYAFKYL